MRLSQQQKEILGWAYVVSQAKGYLPWWHHDRWYYDRRNCSIAKKPIRIEISCKRHRHEHPTRSESASISRSFVRLYKAGLIEPIKPPKSGLNYLRAFFLTSEGKRIAQNYTTPAMWERVRSDQIG